LAVPVSSPSQAFPLVRLPYPAEFSTCCASAGIGSALPSCPCPLQAGLQGLHATGSRKTIDLFSGSSHGLRLPFRGCPSTEPLHRVLGFPRNSTLRLAERHSAAPPLRSRPLQRLPARSSGMNLVGPASPNRLRLQVFTTSWRVHPPRACRPCFMPDPLLGSTLQSLFPPAQPYAVSSAVPLLAFEPPSGFFSTRESTTRSRGLA